MVSRFRIRILLVSAALVLGAVVVGIVATSSASIPTLRRPIVVSGSGQGLSKPFELGPGLTILSATTTEGRPADFWIRTSNGELLPSQLQLTLDQTSGASLDVVSAGKYRLSVATAGPWSVTLSQPRPKNGTSFPHSFTGVGEQVVGPVELPGYVAFTLNAAMPSQNFANASIAAIAGLTKLDAAGCSGDSDDLFTQVGPTYIAVTSYIPGFKWELQVGPPPPLSPRGGEGDEFGC